MPPSTPAQKVHASHPALMWIGGRGHPSVSGTYWMDNEPNDKVSEWDEWDEEAVMNGDLPTLPTTPPPPGLWVVSSW